MDTTAIKQEIDDNIKTNGEEAITGQVLNDTLNDIVDAVTPQLYNESKSDERVTIETDGTINVYGGEKINLRTAGYMLQLSEEEGVKIGIDNYVTIEINPDTGVTINGSVNINDERVLTDSDLTFFSRVLGVDYFYSNIQYSIGDLVLYQNILYQFKNNHIGEWNFSDVQETNLRTLLNF